jgi:hypothetical protein
VADHVVGLCEGTSKREHDAPSQTFRHTAGSLTDLAANDIGLFEVDVRAIENQRLPPSQIVLKEALEPYSPSLGHTGGDLNAGPFLGIEVDVEVLSLQDLEIEVSILNLVPPEVLR